MKFVLLLFIFTLYSFVHRINAFVLTTAKPIMIKLNKEEYRKARLKLPRRISSLTHKHPKPSVFSDHDIYHDEYDKIRHIRDVNIANHKSMSDAQMLDHILKLIRIHKSSKVIKKQNAKLSKDKKGKLNKGKTNDKAAVRSNDRNDREKEIKNIDGQSDDIIQTKYRYTKSNLTMNL